MLERLIIETEDDGWITLHLEGRGSFTFEVPGFSADFVGEALIAAGLVNDTDGDLCATTWTDCQRLSGTAQELIGYFDPPSTPSRELNRIRDQLVSAIPDDEVAALPLLGIAWLDWVIRQDLAEAALTAEHWHTDVIKIDVDPIRKQRLAELLTRNRQDQPVTIGPRMAPSVRQRQPDRHFRTG